jgi:hypothetical protein
LGLRVWRDAIAFVEILTVINRRQELVLHDERIIREIELELLRSRPDAPLPEAARVAAAALQGLDPEFDDWLASETQATVADFRRMLARLANAVSSGSGRRPSGVDDGI